jgi:hypothetical protein
MPTTIVSSVFLGALTDSTPLDGGAVDRSWGGRHRGRGFYFTIYAGDWYRVARPSKCDRRRDSTWQ